MAGVLSRPNTKEEIREYFRKEWRRNPGIASDVTYKRRFDTSNTPSKCESLGIWIGQPKYRHYSTVLSRTESFKNWPQNKSQKIDELVEAGFAYTGVDDAVRCFYCSVGLRDWPDGASPWKQHVFASPKCGHVIQCKGKGFVRQILGEREQYSESDIDDSEEVIDTVQLSIQRNRDAVTVAREYYSDENILKTAIKSLIKKDYNKKFTAVELVQAIEEFDELSKSEKPEEEETNESDVESVQNMTETNRKLRDPVMCKMCCNALACIITLPCGHLVSCSQCISALTTCAVCGAPIKGTVRALMAF